MLTIAKNNRMVFRATELFVLYVKISVRRKQSLNTHAIASFCNIFVYLCT